MRNLLIIYPHWPPSNLAGVHRPRLIANFLTGLGWHPILLTVHHDFYEEKLDWDMLKLVRKAIEVHSVTAKKIKKPRLIGDIGLRAFGSLKKKAIQIIGEKKIDFIWIPIPSFYTAVLGRVIFNKTGIPYGIDYIDPWVRDINNRKSIRSVLSILIARIIEPYAIKKATLISGVAEAYFKPAIKRNFKSKTPVQVAMPYGFDPLDHQVKLENIDYPWNNYPGCIPLVYAGAFLPNSGLFIDILFKAIANLKGEGKFDEKVKLFFIGTGNYRHKSISEYAAENSINGHIIEIRERFPYLRILNFLSASNGVILIGSTEKHYTASKTFQAILSGKPVFAMLHAESMAVNVFQDCRAEAYLVKYFEEREKDFYTETEKKFESFLNQDKLYQPDLFSLDKYSSGQSASDLVNAIESVLKT